MLELRRFFVSGFKAVDQFSMTVRPGITLLVGMNGAGKSSILQAFAFARHLAAEETSSFFKERHWDRNALKFRAPGHRSTVVSIRAIFRSSEFGSIRWSIGWGINGGRLTKETVEIRRAPSEDPETIFSFDSKRGGRIGTEELPALGFTGSLLAAIQTLALSGEQKTITREVLHWLHGIQSLELLSPAAMKGGTRLSPGAMGIKGDRLAGFLASLSIEQKSRVVQRVAQFYPLADMDTVRKRAGWVDLILTERYEQLGAIRSQHMSDGFMRILALSAIPELGDNVSLVLLDEVEDGIEPHILSELITLVGRETCAQIIATTHSPLLANVIGIENLRFISRTNNGRTVAAEAAAMPALQNGSEFFGPGEMWLNTEANVLRSQALANTSFDRDEAETG